MLQYYTSMTLTGLVYLLISFFVSGDTGVPGDPSNFRFNSMVVQAGPRFIIGPSALQFIRSSGNVTTNRGCI
jgi:hypothetical protein